MSRGELRKLTDPFEVEKAFKMPGAAKNLASGAKMGFKGAKVSSPSGAAGMGAKMGEGASKTMGAVKPAAASAKAALTPLAAATNRLKKPLAAGAAVGGAGGYMAGKRKQS